MQSATENSIIKILSHLDVPGNAAKIYFIEIATSLWLSFCEKRIF